MNSIKLAITAALVNVATQNEIFVPEGSTYAIEMIKHHHKKIAPASHPIVKITNKDIFDLDQAESKADLEHMSQGDLDSFFFYKGFIQQSVKLSDDKTELLKNENFNNIDKFEGNFKGVHNTIAHPIHRIMDIYTITHTKRTEYMKIWRIISGLSNVMTDSPDYLIHVHDINPDLMKFVVMKAWPLTDMPIE